MPRLIIKKPLGHTVTVPLVEASYSVGRAADNAIVLDGSMISRRHGMISREGSAFRIEDLSSHNGIFVNGEKVEQTALKDKDEIQIGNYLMVYYEAASALLDTHTGETITVEEDFEHLVSQLTSSVSRPPSQPALQATLQSAQQPEEGALLKQMQKERRTLGLLIDLSRALSTVYSLDEVSRKAIQILLETTQAERGAIFLLEEDGETLRPTMVSERDGLSKDLGPVALSSTVANRILTERKGIITADAAEDPRFAHGQSVVLRGLRSIACAPLVGKGGNLGILYVENNRFIGAFKHDDLELLCAVAAQVGLSVENAKFFESLKRSNEELERKVAERTAALRQSELKLYQTEKMASLSRLVAGVAHEINNPLGALKGNLEIATVMSGRIATTEGRSEKETKLLEQLVRITQESVSACARIMSTVRSLRSFARLDESEFKMANVNDGINATVPLLDPSVRRRIEVALNLGEVPAIPCYPALLNEVFMNVLTNACQAIKQTGQIFIDTRREGEFVVVQIRDTGVGIAREHLEKIFEPGFTTKGVGVGVGLGLPIAYSVIREHRGAIQVASQLGQGATFTIRLPIAMEQPPAAPN